MASSRSLQVRQDGTGFVAAYMRVSTDRQDVSRQEEGVLSLAASFGKPVVVFPEEGVSAWSFPIDERPEGTKLLRAIRAGEVHAVVADEQSRFERGGPHAWLTFAHACHSTGTLIQTVTGGKIDSSGIGDLVGVCLAIGHRQASEDKSHYGKTKRLEMAKDGLWFGSKPPLGYTRLPGGKLDPNEFAPLIQRVFTEYDKGASLNSLLALIGQETGGNWKYRNRLTDALRNRTYLGLIGLNDSEYEGQHPALIEGNLFERVQDRLDANASVSYRDQRRSPFGAILKCECGGSLKLHQDKRGKGWNNYDCDGCGRKAVLGEFVEFATAYSIPMATHLIRMANDRVPEWLAQTFDGSGDKLEEQIADLDVRADRLLDLVESGDGKAKERYDLNRQQKADLSKRLRRTQESGRYRREAIDHHISLVDKFIGGQQIRLTAEGIDVQGPFVEAWKAASVEQRHSLIRGLCTKIVVKKDVSMIHLDFLAYPGGTDAPMPSGNRHSTESKIIRREFQNIHSLSVSPS